MSKDKIEIDNSKIKFDHLLNLVDKAINTGQQIQLQKRMSSQSNTTMKFLKWLEKHKIISLIYTEKMPPKKISIRSRARRIEIALQLYALNVSIEEIAKIFEVKLNTARGYLKELDNYSKEYLNLLSIALNLKQVSSETKITNFPSFPIRVSLNSIKQKLNQYEYEQLINYVMKDKYIKKVTGQLLGSSDLSFLLPKK